MIRPQMGNAQKQRGDGAVDAKKAYASPQLVEYGRATDLLAGGTGSMVEPNPPMGEMLQFPG
jgi:hypothetical protein